MSTPTNEQVTFIQFHEPSLKDGTYKVNLQQKVSFPNEPDWGGSYEVNKEFYVAGDRFVINPQEIFARFPPSNNFGDHANVLPHIILKRSTLPWERIADGNDNELPWLWLFLFDDNDLASGHVKKPIVMPVNEVVNFSSEANAGLISLTREPHEDETEKVCVIRVKQAWARKCNIIPSRAALKLMNSVRKNVNETFLFSIGSQSLDSDTQTLDRGNMPTCIQSAFVNHNRNLPESAKVEVVTKGSKWQITYQDKKFITKAESGPLNIYDRNITEWAICVGNRLPMQGGRSYAHLVSLEHRFTNGAVPDKRPVTFDFSLGLANGYIPFISLAGWTFSCPSDSCYKYTDKAVQRLTKANIPQAIIKDIETLEKGKVYRGTNSFKKTLSKVIGKQKDQTESTIVQCLHFPTETFKGLLDHVDKSDLQLPDLPAQSQNQQYIDIANRYINRGSVALPHHLRQGGKTISWYHGPFISGENKDAIPTVPVTSSDELLRFDTTIGMFDVSYAAAWELGRLMTINNKDIAMRMYAWKRQHAWNLKQAELDIFHDHLPYDRSNQEQQADAGHWHQLMSWFQSLNLLHQVPFNYLVPDEKMLPTESIRFFALDNLWVDCLLDGAFSIGRVTGADVERDASLNTNVSQAKYPVITGFLLRSDVVSGWPGLIVNGSSQMLHKKQIPDNQSPLPLLRMERLAPNILLCLFDGKLQTVDIHLKPESLHFGFVRPFGDHADYYKELKKLSDGTENGKTVEIQWMGSTTNGKIPSRVVDIVSLRNSIAIKLGQESKNLTSAQFALEMIEGVPRIRFQLYEVDELSPSTR